eukprot:jgi/Botrbrau1/9792/Bobra.0322s0002.3
MPSPPPPMPEASGVPVKPSLPDALACRTSPRPEECQLPPDIATSIAPSPPDVMTSDPLSPPHILTCNALSPRDVVTSHVLSPPDIVTCDALSPPDVVTCDTLSPPDIMTSDALSPPDVVTSDAPSPPDVVTCDALGSTPSHELQLKRPSMNHHQGSLPDLTRSKDFSNAPLPDENFVRPESEPVQRLPSSTPVETAPAPERATSDEQQAQTTSADSGTSPNPELSGLHTADLALSHMEQVRRPSMDHEMGLILAPLQDISPGEGSSPEQQSRGSETGILLGSVPASRSESSRWESERSREQLLTRPTIEHERKPANLAELEANQSEPLLEQQSSTQQIEHTGYILPSPEQQSTALDIDNTFDIPPSPEQQLTPPEIACTDDIPPLTEQHSTAPAIEQPADILPPHEQPLSAPEVQHTGDSQPSTEQQSLAPENKHTADTPPSSEQHVPGPEVQHSGDIPSSLEQHLTPSEVKHADDLPPSPEPQSPALEMKPTADFPPKLEQHLTAPEIGSVQGPSAVSIVESATLEIGLSLEPQSNRGPLEDGGQPNPNDQGEGSFHADSAQQEVFESVDATERPPERPQVPSSAPADEHSYVGVPKGSPDGEKEPGSASPKRGHGGVETEMELTIVQGASSDPASQSASTRQPELGQEQTREDYPQATASRSLSCNAGVTAEARIQDLCSIGPERESQQHCSSGAVSAACDGSVTDSGTGHGLSCKDTSSGDAGMSEKTLPESPNRHPEVDWHGSAGDVPSGIAEDVSKAATKDTLSFMDNTVRENEDGNMQRRGAKEKSGDGQPLTGIGGEVEGTLQVLTLSIHAFSCPAPDEQLSCDSSAALDEQLPRGSSTALDEQLPRGSSAVLVEQLPRGISAVINQEVPREGSAATNDFAQELELETGEQDKDAVGCGEVSQDASPLQCFPPQDLGTLRNHDHQPGHVPVPGSLRDPSEGQSTRRESSFLCHENCTQPSPPRSCSAKELVQETVYTTPANLDAAGVGHSRQSQTADPLCRQSSAPLEAAPSSLSLPSEGLSLGGARGPCTGSPGTEPAPVRQTSCNCAPDPPAVATGGEGPAWNLPLTTTSSGSSSGERTGVTACGPNPGPAPSHVVEVPNALEKNSSTDRHLHSPQSRSGNGFGRTHACTTPGPHSNATCVSTRTDHRSRSSASSMQQRGEQVERSPTGSLVSRDMLRHNTLHGSAARRHGQPPPNHSTCGSFQGSGEGQNMTCQCDHVGAYVGAYGGHGRHRDNLVIVSPSSPGPVSASQGSIKAWTPIRTPPSPLLSKSPGSAWGSPKGPTKADILHAQAKLKQHAEQQEQAFAAWLAKKNGAKQSQGSLPSAWTANCP